MLSRYAKFAVLRQGNRPQHFLKELIDDARDKAGGGGGGGDIPTGSADQADLEEFKPSGGRLALAYGQHVVGGHLMRTDYNAGPPPLHKLAVALGEGGDLGWDSVVKVTWGGEALSASPDGTTVGYHFHPGTYSTGNADSAQGQDTFFTSPLTWNGTAYVALRLTEAQSSENVTDKHRGFYKCLKVYSYDANGRASASAAYSVNPADIIADGFRRTGMLSRVHWPSLYALRQQCAEAISWNDGTSTRNIARFEAHPVWSDRVSLPDFVEAVCLTCGATPQDDGAHIRFKLVTDQVPVHAFDSESNMTGFRAEPDDVRTRVNRLKISCRDLDDENLRNVTLTLDREALQLRYPVVEQAVTVPNMNQSQLRRVGEMLLRLVTDNPNKARFMGFADAWHVLPGDYVTVTHPVTGWTDALCRVEEVADFATRTQPDRREFLVRKVSGPLYKDSDHTVRQQPE